MFRIVQGICIQDLLYLAEINCPFKTMKLNYCYCLARNRSLWDKIAMSTSLNLGQKFNSIVNVELNGSRLNHFLVIVRTYIKMWGVPIKILNLKG